MITHWNVWYDINDVYNINDSYDMNDMFTFILKAYDVSWYVICILKCMI